MSQELIIFSPHTFRNVDVESELEMPQVWLSLFNWKWFGQEMITSNDILHASLHLRILNWNCTSAWMYVSHYTKQVMYQVIHCLEFDLLRNQHYRNLLVFADWLRVRVTGDLRSHINMQLQKKAEKRIFGLNNCGVMYLCSHFRIHFV